MLFQLEGVGPEVMVRQGDKLLHQIFRHQMVCLRTLIIRYHLRIMASSDFFPCVIQLLLQLGACGIVSLAVGDVNEHCDGGSLEILILS